MKKLMIAAAIVCAAALSQAATISWTVNPFPMFTGADGSTALAQGSTAYLVQDWANNKTAILAALANGTFDSNVAGYVGQSVTGNTMGGVTELPSASDSLVYNKGATKYDFAVILIDENTKAGETWYNVSTVSQKAAYDPDHLTDFEKQTATYSAMTDFATATSQSGGWQKLESVPEPTSGLLLLLGVAGLALRRRRA